LNRRQRSRGTTLLLLKAAISITLLIVIFSFVPFRVVAEGLLGADLRYVLLGVAMTPATLLVGAVYTRMLAQRQGLTLTIGQILRIGYATQFYALFLPGVIAGGAIRWYKLARHDGKPVEALTTIAFSRLMNLSVGLAIGLACWLLDDTARANVGWGVGLALVWSAVAGSQWLLFHPERARAVGGFVEARRWIPGPLRGALTRVLTSAACFGRLGRSQLLRLCALTTLENVLGVVSFIAFAWAVGIDLAPISIAWVRAYMLLVALLPITLGGIGAREGSLFVLLGVYGVAPELAVTYGLLLFARRLFTALVGAAVEVQGMLFPSVGARGVPRRATVTGEPR
jgi:uncharacterized membrane protein YbhN (UPF0104 family)